MINEPEQPEGFDQQKLEGSEAQKTRSVKDKHELDKIHVTRNKRRKERQKQNKHNFMNKRRTYKNSTYVQKQERERKYQGRRGGCTGLRPATTTPSPAAKRKTAG